MRKIALATSSRMRPGWRGNPSRDHNKEGPMIRNWMLAPVVGVIVTGVALSAAAQQVALVKAMPAIPQQLDYMTHAEGGATAYLLAEQASTLLFHEASKAKGQGCEEPPDLQSDLRGHLAESWSINRDGKYVEFKLRKGVKSPAGNEMTAEDVKWSLDRGIKASGIIRFFLFSSSDFRPENTVEAVDASTVRIHFKTPTIFDLSVFAYLYFQILDSKTVLANAAGGDGGAAFLQKNTADFGPWHLTTANFVPGNRATYTANANYWNKAKRGNATSLVTLSVAESATRSQLLRSGEADFAGLLPFQEYENLRGDRGVRVMNCAGVIRDSILLSYNDERFAKPEVREAISLAIDRDAIVRGVFRGFGQPAVTGVHQAFMTPGMNKYIRTDVAKAKELLAKAGYPDGFSAKFTISPSRPGAHAEQEAIFIADSLKQIGVRFEIEVVTSGTAFAERFSKGDYQAMLYSEAPAFGDPFYSLTILNHSAS
ncbi:MAG: hypothetical protein FJX65_19740, partial [Alphaproteobacteria bacterium]|nr:hypothetical protein [Alphaproteobacteria bacterium]